SFHGRRPPEDGRLTPRFRSSGNVLTPFLTVGRLVMAGGGMRGRSASTKRAAAATGLLLAFLAMLPPAAPADTTARGYRPHPNHLSVVVTYNQVYITWATPPGVQP